MGRPSKRRNREQGRTTVAATIGRFRATASLRRGRSHALVGVVCDPSSGARQFLPIHDLDPEDVAEQDMAVSLCAKEWGLDPAAKVELVAAFAALATETRAARSRWARS